MSQDLLSEIYSSFDPFSPCTTATYVDFEEARGGWNILRDIGRTIVRSGQTSCQLFSGNRGSGKSTEILRLNEYLEQQKYFVISFAADEEDIEPQDADYLDILFAFARHLTEKIKLQKGNPLLNWLKFQWDSLKDLAFTEVSIDSLSQEEQISQFAKITTNLRCTPKERYKIRQDINRSTSLLVALKEFIREAQETIIQDFRGLVIIADNLDRIVELKQENGYSNYDEIYINRSEIWRNLGCHVVLTVPLSAFYSQRGIRLQNSYNYLNLLPAIVVRNSDGSVNPVGLHKLRDLI